ncbi:hypothetical protein [Streptomyces sp. NBC_00829]|uniref:hypothetical protein n=1 Tax=Streptomyces sp. NBC_00829 TaxID=2903679 RepID=UPI00386CDFD2|nr:hypothetical protein OG293_33815 [Streptomyces sp. NBC_00829]
MTDLLDAAERIGREELEALQLERLRATLRHAYENVGLVGKIKRIVDLREK